MKEQILSRIEELNTKRFMLDMKDHWNANDYQLSRGWFAEIKTLQQQLDEME